MDENTTTPSLNSIWWEVAPQMREPFISIRRTSAAMTRSTATPDSGRRRRNAKIYVLSKQTSRCELIPTKRHATCVA